MSTAVTNDPRIANERREDIEANALSTAAFPEASRWRELEVHEFFSPITHRRCAHGYAITVKFQGHEYCHCYRSNPFILFYQHHDQLGFFPADLCLARASFRHLVRARPELLVVDNPYCIPSRGCVWDHQRHREEKHGESLGMSEPMVTDSQRSTGPTHHGTTRE